MNIEHISVSRSQIWKDCELKYRFKYHYKTPSPEPEKPYFLYGKVFHKIAEEYVNHKGTKTLHQLAVDILQGKILLEEGKEDQPIPIKTLPAEYIKKLPKHLKAMQGLTDKIGMGGVCEWRFHFDLEPPLEKFAYGFIDRIIQKDNQFFIIDYKTTKKGPWRRTKRDITYDLQLQCYARAVMREFSAKPENIRAGLFYVEGQELLGAKFSEQTLLGAEAKLLEVYNDITNTAPDKAKGWVGERCKRCEYRTLCPLYALT